MRVRFARLTFGLLLATGLGRISLAEAAPPAGPGGDDRFAPLLPPIFAEDERTQLDAGEVVIRDLPPTEPDGLGILLAGLVEAPPDQVWAVMADCEKQEEFIPRVLYAAVLDREGDSHTCELVIGLPIPLADLRSRTRHHVRRLPDGGYQRSWDLLPGDWDYRRNSGSWTVHPYQDGRRSLLVGRMDVQPKSVMPVWLLHSAQVRQAPETFAAIRDRVRQLASHQPLS